MSTNKINIKYMEFNAFKMDGLGNDIVIIDQRVKTINLSKENIVKLCSRDFIGCDQLIYINKIKIIKTNLFSIILMEAFLVPVGTVQDVWLNFYQKNMEKTK